MSSGPRHEAKGSQRTMHLQKAIPNGKNFLVAVLWLCLAYVLSVGPAFYMARQTGYGRQWVHTLYGPLFWVHDNTRLDTPLKWYNEMWEEGMGVKARSAVAQRRSSQDKSTASQLPSPR
jgi:hypothetical protein